MNLSPVELAAVEAALAPTDDDVRRHPAAHSYPSAGTRPGLIDAGASSTECDGAGEATNLVGVAAPTVRFVPCSLCNGALTVVVTDMTAALRRQTGRVLTVMAPCPECAGGGGILERTP